MPPSGRGLRRSAVRTTIKRRYSARLKNSWRNNCMWKDPVVEEVRAIRDAYAKQFNYNLEAIYCDLKEQEAKSEREMVSLPPKRIEPKKRAKLTPESEEEALTS